MKSWLLKVIYRYCSNAWIFLPPRQDSLRSTFFLRVSQSNLDTNTYVQSSLVRAHVVIYVLPLDCRTYCRRRKCLMRLRCSFIKTSDIDKLRLAMQLPVRTTRFCFPLHFLSKCHHCLQKWKQKKERQMRDIPRAIDHESAIIWVYESRFLTNRTCFLASYKTCANKKMRWQIFLAPSLLFAPHS